MLADTPKIDIRPDHWAIVRGILQKRVSQYAVWAFGSRAKWTAKDYSDLDLCIKTDKALDFKTLAKLQEDFAESDLPWKVDIVDWAVISPEFRKIVERDKVVVQEPRRGAGMAGEWREVSLGEVCQQQGGSIQTGPFGSQLHASDYTVVGTPVVMPVNLIDGNISEQGIARVSDAEVAKLTRHKLVSGDIVFSRRGDVTRFALVSERETGWLCGTGCLKVSVGNPTIVTPGFIAAVLASPESKEWLIRHAVGATMPNLNTEILAGIPITLPPIEEQRAIAHILGTLDDKIELNRRMNQTLEAMARALFKSWFVDFDGVPPEDMQESELGLIPKGWRVGTLGEVAEHPRRSVQPEEIEATAPYIALEHMPKRCIALADWGVADGLESNKYEFKRGEILFGKLRPYFHKVGVAPVDGVCSTDIVVIMSKSPAWFGFVLVHTSSDAFVEYTNIGSTGTKMPRTSWLEMSRYAVVLPPEVIATAFNRHVQPAVEKIISNIHESQTITALRDTLLPKLISGELRVEYSDLTGVNHD